MTIQSVGVGAREKSGDRSQNGNREIKRKKQKHYAQWHSKVSELFENLEKHYAQWHSKVSECERARKARKTRKVESWESGNVLCSMTIQSVGVV